MTSIDDVINAFVNGEIPVERKKAVKRRVGNKRIAGPAISPSGGQSGGLADSFGKPGFSGAPAAPKRFAHLKRGGQDR